MARSLKASPKDALLAARGLFWQYGYCGLGTRQIEAETGLTRFTLQTSYGGKKSLYIRVLNQYMDMMEADYISLEPGIGLTPLKAWITRRSDPDSMPDISRFGCLMMNAIMEFQGQDPEINDLAERYLAGLNHFFRAHLEADSITDFQARAEILSAAALGLNAVIRAQADLRAGQTYSASIVKMIDEWEALG